MHYPCIRKLIWSEKNMGTFWTKKKDQEDLDEKTAQPWAELVGHGNTLWPDPDEKARLQ